MKSICTAVLAGMLWATCVHAAPARLASAGLQGLGAPTQRLVAPAPLSAQPARLLAAPPTPLLARSVPRLARPPMEVPDVAISFTSYSRSFRVEPSVYDPMIREVAARNGVDESLVKAVIKAESNFNRLAVSPVGARGLMQLMPATAAWHGVRNSFVPRENIEGGCRHLRYLLDRYDGNVSLAVAAYNAGEARVERAGGVPRIEETQTYLARVLRFRQAYQRIAQSF